jgi:3-phosphoshikimate 1-carboxyvinyltransferase
VVGGRGWAGLKEPANVIDVLNSGTLIRLLPGLVAPLPFLCVLTGDLSIRRRPMARILEPLQSMGAVAMGRQGGTLPPLVIRGGPLRGVTHRMAVASAQVKSCLLLAGLRAEGETTIVEPSASRDHTERMIRFAGGEVQRDPLSGNAGAVRVQPVECLHMDTVAIPGDFSSAAFFLALALLTPDSEVTVVNSGLNPSRTGLLAVFERMGADMRVEPGELVGPEPQGSVTSRTSALVATEVGPAEVPGLIDELPLFLLAAARAEGVSRLRGAAELRTKESDRLQVMGSILRDLGIEVAEYPDGMDVVGNPDGWAGGTVVPEGDHRMAMVGAIAGAASRKGVLVEDVGCIGVSYPGFTETFSSLGGSWSPRIDS